VLALDALADHKEDGEEVGEEKTSDGERLDGVPFPRENLKMIVLEKGPLWRYRFVVPGVVVPVLKMTVLESMCVRQQSCCLHEKGPLWRYRCCRTRCCGTGVGNDCA